MADTKLAILKATINGILNDMLIKTRVDNVFMTDETTTLASKLAEIIQAVNIREKIEDVNKKISAAKEEVNKNASDNLATAKSELNERIDNLTYEDVGATTEAYVDQQILLVTETGIPKLMVYPLPVTATEDNQTVFPIGLDTFDSGTDTVLVQSGRTMLFPQLDYTISEGNVVLTEGVPVDRVIGIYVMKNVPLGEDGSVSGKVIANDTVSLKALKTRYITLLASNWSDTYPYEQTITVDNISSTDDLMVVGVIHAEGNTLEQDKAIDKAAGNLMYYEDGVGDGQVTFRAKKIPEVDFTVITKGA